jgi:hypothetical protein
LDQAVIKKGDVMNLFIGVGKIVSAQEKGNALRFSLALSQEKPCSVPCLMFYPDDKARRLVEGLKANGETVWLQGKVVRAEYEFRGNIVSRFAVITYPKAVKTI